MNKKKIFIILVISVFFLAIGTESCDRYDKCEKTV